MATACSVQFSGVRAEPFRIETATVEELISRLRERLDEAMLDATFRLDFSSPLRSADQEQVTGLVRELAMRSDRPDSGWVDDLVEESGWAGVRCRIDADLGPAFAGHGDGDLRHSGVWVDARTFLHIEVESLLHPRPGDAQWGEEWVALGHGHPDRGSWSDGLRTITPEVLFEDHWMDDDGLSWVLRRRPDVVSATARLITDFIKDVGLGQVGDLILPLMTAGFPTDGSAEAFPIGILTGEGDDHYELFLRMTPPVEVADELRRAGRLSPRAGRRLAATIRRTLADETSFPGMGLEDLGPEWARLLETLEQGPRR